MRPFIFFMLAEIIFSASIMGSNIFSDANSFIQKYSHDWQFDYPSAAKDPELKVLRTEIASYDIAHSSYKEMKSYYIIAYNIYFIDAISQLNNIPQFLYPADAIYDLPFDFGDRMMTLREVEDTIPEVLQDERILFAFNNGTRGISFKYFNYAPTSIDITLTKQESYLFNNSISFIDGLNGNGFYFNICLNSYTTYMQNNTNLLDEYLNFSTPNKKDKTKINYTIPSYELNNYHPQTEPLIAAEK